MATKMVGGNEIDLGPDKPRERPLFADFVREQQSRDQPSAAGMNTLIEPGPRSKPGVKPSSR